MRLVRLGKLHSVIRRRRHGRSNGEKNVKTIEWQKCKILSRKLEHFDDLKVFEKYFVALK